MLIIYAYFHHLYTYNTLAHSTLMSLYWSLNGCIMLKMKRNTSIFYDLMFFCEYAFKFCLDVLMASLLVREINIQSKRLPLITSQMSSLWWNSNGCGGSFNTIRIALSSTDPSATFLFVVRCVFLLKMAM